MTVRVMLLLWVEWCVKGALEASIQETESNKPQANNGYRVGYSTLGFQKWAFEFILAQASSGNECVSTVRAAGFCKVEGKHCLKMSGIISSKSPPCDYPALGPLHPFLARVLFVNPRADYEAILLAAPERLLITHSSGSQPSAPVSLRVGHGLWGTHHCRACWLCEDKVRTYSTLCPRANHWARQLEAGTQWVLCKRLVKWTRRDCLLHSTVSSPSNRTPEFNRG